MRFDIDRLQTFYASPMGRMAQEMIARRVSALWPSAAGLDVLGIGHTVRYQNNRVMDNRRRETCWSVFDEWQDTTVT